jgi:hypothetical protein
MRSRPRIQDEASVLGTRTAALLLESSSHGGKMPMPRGTRDEPGTLAHCLGGITDAMRNDNASRTVGGVVALGQAYGAEVVQKTEDDEVGGEGADA